jgi:hypothetical protein
MLRGCLLVIRGYCVKTGSRNCEVLKSAYKSSSIALDCRAMYDVLLFVRAFVLCQHVKLSNDLVLRLAVSCHVAFLLAVVAGN